MYKKLVFIAISAIFASVMMTGCGSSKQATGNNYTPQPAGSPFGNVYETPCSEQDTDEYFGAVGIANGSKNRMDVLQTSALTNAQNVVRQKMKHAYKGAIDDYSNYIGNNAGSDADAKVERAGTQIIDAVINNTKASCGPKFSSVDEKGNVTCYVGIRVSNKDVVDKIIDNVSKDEELRIRFQESEFRKRMDANFEKFKEDNKQ
ncbi:MAG: hypothetical protein LBQ01_07910 [Prevotellaceae bacterium]|jgi:hypothetical protein|nr:hypothetical protein [Prevotellaceae bacterium]